MSPILLRGSRSTASSAAMCIAAVLMLGSKCFAPQVTAKDSGPDDDAGVDAGVEDGGPCGGSCNDIAQAGEVVTIDQVAADTPSPKGGALVGGTYALTQWQMWVGPGGSPGPGNLTMQSTMLINTAPSGATIELVTSQGACGSDPSHQTLAVPTIPAQSISMTQTETCPAIGSPSVFQYTSAQSDGGVTLTLFSFLDGGAPTTQSFALQ